MTKANTLNLTGAALAAFLAAHASGAAAETVGAVAAVNSDVTGAPPASAPAALALGDDLVLDERIESSALGSGQFLFLDQSSLTVAPNSDIVLDRYIYDPATQAGEFGVSMTRGVLRFIGGRISKNTDAVVRTPIATIGIRGGMSIIIVGADGTTRVMHIAGEYTRITTISGEEITISRSNGVAEVSVDGSLAYLGVADQLLIRETTLALIGRGEAGQRVRPENPDVIASALPGVNSEAKGAAHDRPISTSGESPTDLDFPGRPLERTDPEIATPVDDDATADLRAEPPVDPPVDPPVNPPVDPPVTPPVDPLTPLAGVSGGASIGGASYIFSQVFAGSRIGVTADGETFVIPTEPGFFSFDDGASPEGAVAGFGFFDPVGEFAYAAYETGAGEPGAFLSGAVSGPLPAAAAGRVVARSYDISDDFLTGGAAFTPGLDALAPEGFSDLTLISNIGGQSAGGAATGGAARAVAAYLDIGEAGGAQYSGFGVLTADIAAAGAGTPSFAGAFEGSVHIGGAFLRIDTPVATVEDGSGGSAFGPGAQHFALSNSALLGREGETPGRLIDMNGGVTAFTSRSVASQTAARSLAMTNRETLPSGALTGFAAGVGVDLSTGLRYAASSFNPDMVSFALDRENNALDARIGLDSFSSEDINAFSDLFDLSLAFGGPGGKSALIDDHRYAARDATDGVNSVNFNEFDAAPGPEGQRNFRGALASAALAGDGGIFPASVTPKSEYLTWGWWAGEVRADPAPPCAPNCSATPLGADQRFALGSYVAGDRTDLQNLPTSGVASFGGFAVVSAIVDGANVVDGAGFEMTYDFGAPGGGSGGAVFSDLLGGDVAVEIRAGGGSDLSAYGGYNEEAQIAGELGVFSVNGDFFNGGGDAAQATAGSVSFQTYAGPRVVGSGVYAGDRRPAPPLTGGP